MHKHACLPRRPPTRVMSNTNILIVHAPCATLAFLLALCIPIPAIAEEPDIATLRQWVQVAGFTSDDLQPWPELRTTSGRAYRRSNAVLLSIDHLPAEGTVSFPRLNNMCPLVHWLGDPNRYSLRLTQTGSDWTIHLPQAQPAGARPVVVLRTGRRTLLAHGPVGGDASRGRLGNAPGPPWRGAR